MLTKCNRRTTRNATGTTLAFATLVTWLAALSGPALAQADGGALTFDSLVPVDNPALTAVYIDPDADFSVFKRVAILEPFVAFRTNWQRDQSRARRGRISNRDMQRIKQDVATIFERVMTERLEAAGFEVVDTVGEDVILLRPAIIDLDVTAPDARSTGRTTTYTATAGAATLYIQLFDSVTGEILGRAADRRTARRPGNFLTWSNSVTNRREATRTMGQWADGLIAVLNEQYLPATAPASDSE